MAQPTMADPRAEAVAASRHRSGSVKLEGGFMDNPPAIEPPHQPSPDPLPKPSSVSASSSVSNAVRPSQFSNLRSRFEDKDSGGTTLSSNKLYTSSVSKIKERFLHSGAEPQHHSSGDGTICGGGPGSRLSQEMNLPSGGVAGEHSVNSSSAPSALPTANSSSPVTPALNPKRRSYTEDQNAPPLSPTHHQSQTSSPSLQESLSPRRKKSGGDMKTGFRNQDPSSDPLRLLGQVDQLPVEKTSHVQRFNLTRALFARMEEENRLAQQKDQVVRQRKISPSRVTNSSSPLLSPSKDDKRGGGYLKDPASSSIENRRSRSTSEAPTTRENSSSSDVVFRDKQTGGEARPRPHSSSDRSSHHEIPVGSSDPYDGDASPMRRSRFLDSNGTTDGTVKLLKDGEEATDGKIQSSKRLSNAKDNKDDKQKDSEGGDKEHSTEQQESQRNTPVEEEMINKVSSASSCSVKIADPSSSSFASSFDHSPRPRSSHISGHHAPGSGLSASLRQRSSLASSLNSSPSSSSSSTSLHSKPQRNAVSHHRDTTSSSPLAHHQNPELSSASSSSPLRVGSQNGSPSDDNSQAKKKLLLSKEEIEAALERADSYLANIGSPEETDDDSESIAITSDPVGEAGEVAVEENFQASQFQSQEASCCSPTSLSSSHTREDNQVSSTSSPLLHIGSPASQTQAQAGPLSSPSSSMSSLLSNSNNDLLFEPDQSPPSYRDSTSSLESRSYPETANPPSYHEATSAPFMMMSQKVMQQQQQHLRKPAIPSRPTPIPRRVAPPPPSKKASGESFTHPGAPPPPPAPEPGNVEYDNSTLQKFGDTSTPGNRQGMLLNSDDLVMPEELMHPHTDENIEAKDKDHPDLVTRESGDGSEDVADGDAISSDGEPLEIDYSNLTFIEIPPISSTDDEEEDADSSGDEAVEYHKPTKVSFSRTPIKVFATYSTNDYDRRNEDVDPVAASAEYELEKRVEKMDVFPVELLKGSEGLGLSIIGMGVGADAGLEKLGIFIKTLTQGGAAQRSAKIQVNDQIIEVDGKSLVGVTQAYAASVLRNTSGVVKFLIGREKDPSKSEVARLIQQSLDQDRRREQMKEQENQRLKQLEESFKPKDEVPDSTDSNRVAEVYGQPLVQDPPASEKDGDFLDDKDADSLQDESPGNESPTSEQEEYDLTQERLRMEEESAAGDSTPLSGPPSNAEDGNETSPENSESQPMRAGHTGGSSSSSIGSELEQEKLYVKLKETQSQLAVTESELAKVKAKIVVFENSEAQKKLTEKKLEELNRKFMERDKHFDALKKELSQYKNMMVASQSQHIELEKKVRELGALEKKYHKAKKLIKDYQQREKDFIQERESLLEQQSEKDQQYNSLVKSLKDRIFTLEKDVTEARRAAGLPETLPPSEPLDMTITTATPSPSRLVAATVNGLDDSSMSPLNQSTEDMLETSTSSEMSDMVTTPDVADKIVVEETMNLKYSSPIKRVPTSSQAEVPHEDEEVTPTEEFDAIVNTNLLDSTAYRDKASIAVAGSNAKRRPPSKPAVGPQDSPGSLRSEEADSSSIRSNGTTEDSSSISGQADLMAESGLDMWNKHDGDSTVRKSHLKKKPIAQPSNNKSTEDGMRPPTPPPPFIPSSTVSSPRPRPAPRPSPKPLAKVFNGDKFDQSETTTKMPSTAAVAAVVAISPDLRRDDNASDTSSSVSQGSYDPSRPHAKGILSEIPDGIPDDDTAPSNGDSGGVTLISSKPTSSSGKGFSLPKFNWKLSKGGASSSGDVSGGGVVLLSSRSLGDSRSKNSVSDPGLNSSGITLISRKVLDSSYPDSSYPDLDVSSTGSDSMMVCCELDDDNTEKFTYSFSGTPAADDNPSPNKRSQNQFHSGPITEWSVENVCHWLMALEMDKYADAFREKTIAGSQLLTLDGSKLKAMGVVSSKDRELIKKKVKEMKVNVEREKKQQEKERKQREKEQKKLFKKK